MTLTARPWLDRIDPYSPGRPAASADGSMASNESPIGASPHVVAAVSAAALSAHHYPNPLADELRHELAALHDVDPDQILVGNGSDELIFLLAWAYLAHGGHAVCADPAYRIDEISTYVVGARLTAVPLLDWAHDLDAMAEVEADIAYVVNPHNPTGTVRSLADIERFVQTSRAGLVVVDEAYIDFAEDPDRMSAVGLARSGRAAVLRTFSKIHGLAGLRVGYLVAAPDVIATLRKIRAPFSVGSLAQAGAVAAVRDPAHRQRVRQHTLSHRDELVGRLLHHGISVRPGSGLGVPGTVRISVPSAAGLALLRQSLAMATPNGHE